MTRTGGLCVVLTMWAQLLTAQNQPVALHYFSKSSHELLAKWGYNGATGPEFRGQLNPSSRMASTGNHQSPIDIDTKMTLLVDLPALKFDYRRERISAPNDGHTIQHDKIPGCVLYVCDNKYTTGQFHVHTPSEHTIDRKCFDLEIHFVYKSMSGEVAVVAVMFKSDDSSELDLAPFYELPIKPGEAVLFDGTRNLSDFLPRSRDNFSHT